MFVTFRAALNCTANIPKTPIFGIGLLVIFQRQFISALNAERNVGMKSMPLECNPEQNRQPKLSMRVGAGKSPADSAKSLLPAPTSPPKP